MFDFEHKTVFVLDHGPCMKESSNQMVDFDISTKSRPPVSFFFIIYKDLKFALVFCYLFNNNLLLTWDYTYPLIYLNQVLVQ